MNPRDHWTNYIRTANLFKRVRRIATENKWIPRLAWRGTLCIEWNPTPDAVYLWKLDDVELILVERKWS